MKGRAAVSIASLLLPALAFCFATRESEEAQVIDTLESMYVAATNDDLPLFKRVVTADFFTFDGGRQFSAETLMQFVKDAHAAGKRYVWKVTDPKVEIHGDVALVTYTNQGYIQDASGTKAVTWLESAFLRKDEGLWRIRFFHATRVP